MPQDPKHRPGLAVIIGVGKPKGPSSVPPPKWSDDDGDGDNDMPGASSAQDPDQDAKVTPTDAHCFTGDYRCVTCDNYQHDDHSCTKVQGNNFGTEIVGCVDYWEPEASGAGPTDQSGSMGADSAPGGPPSPQADGYPGGGSQGGSY